MTPCCETIEREASEYCDIKPRAGSARARARARVLSPLLICHLLANELALAMALATARREPLER